MENTSFCFANAPRLRQTSLLPGPQFAKVLQIKIRNARVELRPMKKS